MQYISFPLGDMGAGIDRLSAESAIPPGYSEALLNVDPTPEGYLRKRPGYGSTSGWLPIRIASVSGTAGSQDLCFFLDSGADVTSIDLSELRSTPIVVHGKLASTYGSGWDLTATDSAHYYTGFSPDIRYTFASGSSTNSINGSTHNLGENLFIGVASSDSTIANDNSPFLPNEAEVVVVGDNVNVHYTNGSASFEGFIYLLSGATDPGTVYNQTGVWSGPTLAINAATHQLTNFNIIPVLYEGDGTSWREVACEVTISNSGTVTFTAASSFTGAYTNYLAILRSVASTQTYAINLPANTTVFATISPLDSAFLISAAYEDDGTTRTRILPDNISIVGDVATVTLTNGSPTSTLVDIYWEYGRLITNKVCVTNSVVATGDFATDQCEVSIWGIGHESIYAAGLPRAGWVTHIDNYRSEGEEHLVAGLGGTLYEPSLDATSYLLPTAYPRLRNRIASSVTIGPAFGTSTGRTRGTASFSGDATGYARATTINYQSGTGYVRYTLDTPSLSVTGTPISVTLDLEDRLTVTQAANSVHNGVFKIVAVSYGISTMTLDVVNSLVDSTDYDEQDCGAQVGVYSDQLPLTATNDFIPGDTLTSTGISSSENYSVLSGTSSIAVIGGTTTTVTLAGSIRIAASRIANTIPLRTIDDTPSSTNFVKGDIISYSEISRNPQITYVNALADTAVTITASSGVATVSGVSTIGMSIGQRIVLVRSGVYTGEHIIVDIPSLTSLEFFSAETSSVAGVVLGNTIEVNEALSWGDTVTGTTTISVPSRWTPIEAPTDSYNTTTKAFPKYFTSTSYTDQAILRSTISNDNMYFTNGDDEVMKYDGINIYRAGLIRWESQLFVTVDTGASGKIALNNPSIVAADITAQQVNVFKVGIGQESKFIAGQTVSVTDGTNTILAPVASIWQDSGSGYLKLDYTAGVLPTFVLASTTITLVANFKYYFRLNMVDANSNLIASAVTGADDYVVNMTQDAAVRLRLLGLPAWATYDYDRIEVEIYRTKAGSVAPFYKLVTLSVPFNNYDGYIDYVDTNSDDTLSQFDTIATATVGAQIANAFSEPLRAKYLTTAENRLILANIKDYPKISSTFRVTGSPTQASFSGKIVKILSDYSASDAGTTNTTQMNFEYRTTGDIAAAVTLPGSGNTYTVTAAGTYASGDWVYLFHSTAGATKSLSFAGWYQVVTGGTGSFTIVGLSGITASTDIDRLVYATNKADVPVWLGTDYNYQTKNGNDFTLVTLTALRRLTNAINATQRVCQTAGFKPWIVAAGGSEFGGETLILSRPNSNTTAFGLTLPTAITGIDFFVNDLKRTAGQSVSSRVQLFSSRVVMSYPQFPEIFDRPTDQATNSTLVYDINPADGQSITGILPFFGDSAFGGATSSSVLVVFKTNSVYILDVGGNTIDDVRVQKLDSRGIGCTAPFSIASALNSIIFASDSGIYRLKSNLQVEYVGRRIERLWQEDINLSHLDIMSGHYYPLTNQYKLSVPSSSATSNDLALVYNTVREYQADGFRNGSWTEYDNMPSVGWCNNTSTGFMAGTQGDVFEVYTVTSEKPYRDNGSAIEAVATLRSIDFGDASRRKAVGWVVVDYRTASGLDTNTEVLSSIDNKDQFEPSDSALIKEYDTVNDGLGSSGQVKVRTVRYSVNRRKCVFFQLQFRNSELDSEMEIAGVGIRVAGMSEKGITEAAST